MNYRSLMLLLPVAMVLAPACAVGPSAFCVLPGDGVEAFRKNCSVVRPITEYTEEGEVTSYVVSSAGYTATVEPEDGVVEVIRFRQDPLPVSDLRVGDRFDSVRASNKAMKLVFGLGESEYLALADEAKGVYIAFDVSDLPSDWRSSVANEKTLSSAKVVAVNLVLPR